MSRNIARYSITSGLAGCYMPDNGPQAIEAYTRKELAGIIRSEIEMQDFPANTFSQVNIRRLWRFIVRNGSSVAHFRIEHKGREIAFSGLTEEEYNAAPAEDR